MKRFLTFLAAAVSVAFAVTSCQENNPEVAGPAITWPSNPDFETLNVTEDMDVKISITAPAGIASFVVTVDSEALEEILGTSTIDFINPADITVGGVVTMILGEGVSVKGATELNLDLSNLIPLILSVTAEDTEDSDHIFRLDVADANGKPATASCTFHRVADSAETPGTDSPVTVADADLWLNTAELTVSPEVTSIAYREKGAQEWITLTAEEDGTYLIAPVWVDRQNDAGNDIAVPEEGTGIWAGKTYEFQVNGETVEYTYTAGKGDVIPNGDMSGWSLKDGSIPYPNAEGESFWDSGNNSMSSSLCVSDTESGAAVLTPYSLSLGDFKAFACGNLYTGSFSFSLPSGTASFGQVYKWTARPKSLKVSYKSNIGKIDFVGSSDPQQDLEGSVDVARIYAVVIDWTERHDVTSGLGAPTGMWDPCTAYSVEEGNIIGYANLEITESQSEFKDVEIPFEWYNTGLKPEEGNYSLVISCATSNRGDYLTGCSTNKLWVDDFAWVY